MAKLILYSKGQGKSDKSTFHASFPMCLNLADSSTLESNDFKTWAKGDSFFIMNLFQVMKLFNYRPLELCDA